MNDTAVLDVDIEFERNWLIEQKAQTDTETGKPVTWEKLARSMGVNDKTLSLFGTNNYKAGREDLRANEVRQFRERLLHKSEVQKGRLVEPRFVETPTATKVNSLLSIAHSGQITMVCMGPGTSKTYVAEHYKMKFGGNIWMATMEPVSDRLSAMLFTLLKALGSTEKGSCAWMSEQIKEMLRGKKGLIMVDEANNLSFECLDQLRAFHDKTGVGICLLGNEELYTTIYSGKRHHAFGRLASRIDQYHVQDLPTDEDILLYLDAWGITDAAMRRMLKNAGLQRSAGGLREIKKIIQSGALLASANEVPLSVEHLREAQSMRSTRSMRIVG